MLDLVISYWPIAVVVLLIGTAILLWAFARRRSVYLATPTLDDAPPSATLARVVPKAPADPMAGAPPTAITVGASDLTRLKGIGPRLAGVLGELGVERVEQIAEWSPDDLARIDGQLGSFAGRAERDQWIAQARLLADGDIAAYQARFGNIDGPPA